MKNKNRSSKDKLAQLDHLFLIDSDLLPLIDKAKNGCLDSQTDLAIAFGNGEGAKKNEKLAKEFEQLMFETTDDNNLKLAVLWNPAIRDSENGNLDEMIAKFHVAIDFMQENIPMEKWDFSLFAIMEELTQLRN